MNRLSYDESSIPENFYEHPRFIGLAKNELFALTYKQI